MEVSEILSKLWESVNTLGGYRPTERNYDQGYVDGIGAALAEIEKLQEATRDPKLGMTHVRIDDEELNSKRRFACGLGPELPDGDKYFFAAEEAASRHVDCPICAQFLGIEPQRLGTPASELSGRPGQPGYERFKEIARSWGYD